MSKIIDLDVATPENTIHDESQIKLEPKYLRMTVGNKYLGCSRSTFYKIIEDAERTKGFENITISVSAGLKLVKITVLDDYLEYVNSKWL
ncbi:hypothetical protein ACMGE5_10230 [Macrococcus equi]|uniref:hypothetical protein n=1 Tax=Macrococcus equi TaxID=3395462 RepID=UPI0039BE729A